MNDGHEIICELFISCLDRRIVHNESNPKTLEEPVEVIPGDATEPVFIGNHNFLDFSSNAGVQ
jgi:hypothetical protein